jgi:hypothetical protein
LKLAIPGLCGWMSRIWSSRSDPCGCWSSFTTSCPTSSCNCPKRQRLDWHPITVEFMIFVIAALAGAKVREVMNELDRRDPLHHFEPQLIFAA